MLAYDRKTDQALIYVHWACWAFFLYLCVAPWTDVAGTVKIMVVVFAVMAVCNVYRNLMRRPETRPHWGDVYVRWGSTAASLLGLAVSLLLFSGVF